MSLYWINWINLICLGIASGVIADSKGHNKWLWGFIGFMLPPALLITLLLKEKK